MDRKHELTEETKQWWGHTLHRIRALRDFGDVQLGNLGGWVERKENLSHFGDAWVAVMALRLAVRLVSTFVSILSLSDL